MRSKALLVFLVLHASSAAAQTRPEDSPISGIAAGKDGTLLVSPSPRGPSSVLELDASGNLVREWKVPEGAAVEVIDADPSGRPICLEASGARILVLQESGEPKSLALTGLKGVDPRALAPIVRSAPDGDLFFLAGDGTKVYESSITGETKSMALEPPVGAVADFDVGDDGRIGVLDPQSGKVRVYGPDGKSLHELSIEAPGQVPALIRFAPGGEAWVLDLPAQPEGGRPAAGLTRFDAKGKRAVRIDRTDGNPLEPIAGIAPAKDGVWLASLDGEARRVDAKGKMAARFDAAPPPAGTTWEEKKRLLALDAKAAPLSDVIAALGVVRGSKSEPLWERVVGEAKAAAPLFLEAGVAGRVESPALATFFVKTKPETLDLLKTAFASKSPSVRVAAVAVLRDPGVTGFDAELAAASKDELADVRAAAVVVLSRNRWSTKIAPLRVARLGDAEPQIAELALQALAARLEESVAEVCKAVSTAKSDRLRTNAARALLLDVPGGDRLAPLPAAKRAPLRNLTLSADAKVRRVGALALLVHGDAAGPAAFEKAWPTLGPEHKQLGLFAWPPATGDAGANVLIRLIAKEKNEDLRPLIFDALARQSGAVARNHLVKLATSKTAPERDRSLALERVQRKLSDAQIAAMADELPQAGTVLRRSILRIASARGVTAAAPKIAALANSEADRQEAFHALYRLGSADGVPVALERLAAGSATPQVELSYLAAIGGLPEAARPRFREMAAGNDAGALLAAEALARSGDATGLPRLLDAVRTDRYGGEAPRDGSLVGAIAKLGDAGRAAMVPLLGDANPAAREDAALALALIGGAACDDLRAWGAGSKPAGVAVPASFYALAACGDVKGAEKVYADALKPERRGDPTAQTAEPKAFATLLAELLRQPDFREKSEPVLQAASLLPRPVVAAVAQALSQELHPSVAVPAVKYIF